MKTWRVAAFPSGQTSLPLSLCLQSPRAAIVISRPVSCFLFPEAFGSRARASRPLNSISVPLVAGGSKEKIAATNEPVIRKSVMQFPEGPGLGLEINEDWLRQHLAKVETW